MRFLIASDLHTEFSGYEPPARALCDFDAVILAGDIMPNTRKLPGWLTRPSVFGADIPIVLVLGNHEFYGGQLQSRRQEIEDAAARFGNVHVLDPGEARLDHARVRILGATLWTDFNLPVRTPTGMESNQTHAMESAARCLNDCQQLADARVRERTRGRVLRHSQVVGAWSHTRQLRLSPWQCSRRLQPSRLSRWIWSLRKPALRADHDHRDLKMPSIQRRTRLTKCSHQ